MDLLDTNIYFWPVGEEKKPQMGDRAGLLGRRSDENGPVRFSIFSNLCVSITGMLIGVALIIMVAIMLSRSTDADVCECAANATSSSFGGWPFIGDNDDNRNNGVCSADRNMRSCAACSCANTTSAFATLTNNNNAHTPNTHKLHSPYTLHSTRPTY